MCERKADHWHVYGLTDEKANFSIHSTDSFVKRQPLPRVRRLIPPHYNRSGAVCCVEDLLHPHICCFTHGGASGTGLLRPSNNPAAKMRQKRTIWMWTLSVAVT